MIDINKVLIENNIRGVKDIFDIALSYETNDHKYRIYIGKINPFQKILYLTFVIKYKSSFAKRSYSLKDNNIKIGKQHIPIANDMVNIFNDTIMLSAKLESLRYSNCKIYNCFNEN